jgi:hypothetical protein
MDRELSRTLLLLTELLALLIYLLMYIYVVVLFKIMVNKMRLYYTLRSGKISYSIRSKLLDMYDGKAVKIIDPSALFEILRSG